MFRIKNLVCNAFVKASDAYQNNKTKIIGFTSALATTASAFAIKASAATETVDVSGQLVEAMSSVDYNIVLTTVVALIPVAFPAVFNLTAIRKGISWVLGLMRGA